ncbi:MAG: WXG100 family type VII secretion target [Actinomycetota bacterium]|nr:WXG100 family type VII secretion target [Actinomycetota bacterium]
MADSYGTQLDTMQQASQHVHDVNQHVQQQLSSLMGRLEPLASTWKGTAAASFHALHLRWNEDASRLNRALADIADAIASSKQTYHVANDTQASSFSNITSALG